MTIISKPSNDKNLEKIAIPLFVDNGNNEATAPTASVLDDTESLQSNSVLPRKLYMKTLCLFWVAFFVMCMGIIGGFIIYRMYVPGQTNKFRFQGLCGFPYENDILSNPEMLINSDNLETDLMNDILFRDFGEILQKEFNKELNKSEFHEKFDLAEGDGESYAKIDIPDLAEVKQSRFVYDFNKNQTGIIDPIAERCFIMSLDRTHVLPPKDLFDLLTKTINGYYSIDIQTIREDMRVVLPALVDLSDISPKIVDECNGNRMYKLEKFVSGVYKRSIDDSPNLKYGCYAGKDITLINVQNMNEVEKYERRK